MSRQPNILLIFTDQQRFDTIGALGNPVIRTPNLDRIANEGVAFTSAYSPSPVCVSARCSMIYSQYPHETGCVANMPMPADDRQSFMGALTEAGYRTHGVGKCHFTPDRNALRGFETRERQEERVPDWRDDDYLPWLREQGFGHVADPHGVRGEMYYVPQPAQMPARAHPTQWVGDRSIEFIERQAASPQPWFLFSSYMHPHPPFSPPAPWHKLYRAALMPLPKLPPDFESLHTWINRRQNRYKYRDQGFDLNLVRCLRAYYYACVSFIDYQVGRLLEALETTGQLDNTLVMMTSDHGEHLGDYACFGKRSMHDTAARVCLLARLPGVFEGGGRCDRPASLVDVGPTALARAGARISTHEAAGIDLADLAADCAERDMVFSQHGKREDAAYMGVSERWKYFYSAPDNREFLFDRVGDPHETRNRAGVVFCQDALKEMRGRVIEFLKNGGVTDAADGDGWKRYPSPPWPNDPDTGLLIQDHLWADATIPGYTDPDEANG